jgi:Leucine-rich repeat (LRR) protein
LKTFVWGNAALPDSYSTNRADRNVLQHNQLTGSVPDSYSELLSLELFCLGNMLSTLPAFLGSFTSLAALSVSSNAFTGSAWVI